MPTEPAPAAAVKPPKVVFAHESEAEIARLLDFYGVRWEYEPRTFPLEVDEQGRVREAFSPDFYLPEYDLFLEITTISAALMNRKHRKIRKLREQYPDVNIRMFTLRDLHALLLKRTGRQSGEQAAE